jgi:uncharacterized membrane protein YgcG
MLLLFLCLLTATTLARADERILDYHSDIRVYKDSSMIVTETIRVRAEGSKIKRGIYRDFPTTYNDKHGNRYVVGFDILDIKRDGKKENYHTEKLSNGIRIYLGRSSYYLPTGEYTYTIAYRTTRQLGYFEQHDELYWNVTGTGWDFPIDKASATVTLPPGIDSSTMRSKAYTGAQGTTGADYTDTINADSTVDFATTRQLYAREGLTIVVGWPKGFVHEPDMAERLGYILADNKNLMVLVIGTILLLLYYTMLWHKVGRDPEKSVIIPRFEPPESISPAAARYIMHMGFDDKAFAAAIINMAVKGYLSVTESEGGILGLGSKDITLTRESDDKSALTPGEKRVANRLFPGNAKTIKLKNTNHQKISDAKSKLEKYLDDEYNKVYFLLNIGFLVPGFILSVLTIFVAGISASSEPGAFLFLSLWLSIWSIAVFTLWIQKHFFIAMVFTFFEVMAIGFLTMLTSVWFAVGVVTIVMINLAFFYLMRAPTHAGRKVMDRLEGFRMFMAVAEKDRLNIMHPPEKTPELFEKYLPYALALGVEQEWAEQFSDVLSQVHDGEQYRPRWYHGRGWYAGNYASFTSGLASGMTSTIASASTAPGSSGGGGFSGGGSSGGGGGGGGGGGW